MLVVALAFIKRSWLLSIAMVDGGGEEPQREETKLPIAFVLASRQPHASHSITAADIIINNGDDAEKSKYCMPVGVALMQQ